MSIGQIFRKLAIHLLSGECFKRFNEATFTHFTLLIHPNVCPETADENLQSLGRLMFYNINTTLNELC